MPIYNRCDNIWISTVRGVVNLDIVPAMPHYPKRHWWLARLVVKEPGKGAGPRLLRAALRTARITCPLPVLVAPGGYGSDPARLSAWYQRQGFKIYESGKLLIYEFPR